MLVDQCQEPERAAPVGAIGHEVPTPHMVGLHGPGRGSRGLAPPATALARRAHTQSFEATHFLDEFATYGTVFMGQQSADSTIAIARMLLRIGNDACRQFMPILSGILGFIQVG